MQLNRATVLAVLVTLSMAAPSSKKDKHDKDHKNDKDDGSVVAVPDGGYAVHDVSCPLYTEIKGGCVCVRGDKMAS